MLFLNNNKEKWDVVVTASVSDLCILVSFIFCCCKIFGIAA